MTAFPLWLFGAGARLIPLTRIGFLQYIAPTVTLFLGLAIFHQTFDSWRAGTFVCIWIALALYTTDNLRRSSLATFPHSS